MEYIYTHGIFSDESSNFVKPFEPSSTEPVKVMLRCMKNSVAKAFICTANNRREMYKITHNEGELFDFYEAEFPPSKETLCYFFYVESDKGNLFYNRHGASKNYQWDGWFQVFKDFETPSWARGAVLYQIYPDRFCNGDPTNDVVDNEYEYLGQHAKKIKDWHALPETLDIANFYGGDLQGVMDKLDYLVDLGIEGIYFTPLFVSPSNHKYDAQDYMHIDPHLGKIIEDCEGDLKVGERYKKRVTSEENLKASDKLFAKLTEKAHKKGMRIMIDGVFNHCGAFHKWLNAKGIYDTPKLGDSPNRDYFYWNDEGYYEGWWGHDNHPKLNVESCKELEQQLYEIGQHWVSAPYFVDAWRLDVAADLGRTEAFNHEFWRNYRTAVKSKKPDALIIAENYGDSSSWLGGDQWDSIMNYDGFMEPVTWFFTGVCKHSEDSNPDMYNNTQAFWGRMHYEMGKMPIQSQMTAMNQLSNHDHSRFLTRTNRQTGRLHTRGADAAGHNVNVNTMKVAVLLQMTWLGMPTLYYGDEAGVVGWTDPDNRRTYPWGRENQDLIDYHKAVIQVRKENICMKYGSLKQLSEQYGVIAYGRFTSDNKCAVVINNSDEAQTVGVPVWEIGVKDKGVMERIFMTEPKGFTSVKTYINVESGYVEMLMPPKSGVILKEIRG